MNFQNFRMLQSGQIKGSKRDFRYGCDLQLQKTVRLYITMCLTTICINFLVAFNSFRKINLNNFQILQSRQIVRE